MGTSVAARRHEARQAGTVSRRGRGWDVAREGGVMGARRGNELGHWSGRYVFCLLSRKEADPGQAWLAPDDLATVASSRTIGLRATTYVLVFRVFAILWAVWDPTWLRRTRSQAALEGRSAWVVSEAVNSLPDCPGCNARSLLPAHWHCHLPLIVVPQWSRQSPKLTGEMCCVRLHCKFGRHE